MKVIFCFVLFFSITCLEAGDAFSLSQFSAVRLQCLKFFQFFLPAGSGLKLMRPCKGAVVNYQHHYLEQENSIHKK